MVRPWVSEITFWYVANKLLIMMHLATQELQRHRRHKMQQLLYQAHIRFNLEPRIQNKKWSSYAFMIYLNSRQAKIDFGIVTIMEPILVRNYQIILSDDLLWHTVTKFSKPRSGQWPSPGTAALPRWAGEVVSYRAYEPSQVDQRSGLLATSVACCDMVVIISLVTTNIWHY